ncbi:UNVERIFIED_CONTAM: hypothetical protein PYX00_009804 [Menopon gallinae]|uniref:Uncharacterized protein n=1 Tax=Menopon gallinae TaxID=328185 RepID=A0AAW2HD09_9NEOP
MGYKGLKDSSEVGDGGDIPSIWLVGHWLVVGQVSGVATWMMMMVWIDRSPAMIVQAVISSSSKSLHEHSFVSAANPPKKHNPISPNKNHR